MTDATAANYYDASNAPPIDQVVRLLNAPFHMASLLSGMRDLGVAVRSDADVPASPVPALITQFSGAYVGSAGPQLPATGQVLVYPCNGSTGMHRALYGERPHPVPGRDLLARPLGRSMYVYSRPGSTLIVGSASLTLSAGGPAIPLLPPSKEGDFAASHHTFIAADVPQAANTAYTFTVSGTVSGTAFSKTCQFTTGSEYIRPEDEPK